MSSTNEQFAEINKIGYYNAVRLATLSLEKAERVAKFNLDVAKAALKQGVQAGGAVRGIKDPKDFVDINAKLAEVSAQQALGYTRGLYEIASQGQAEFSALANDAWAGYAKGVTAWVETVAKNAPAGSEVALKAVTSSVAATNAAYEQITKATQQIVSLTDATVRAAIAKAAPVTKEHKVS
jgi:phasin family protein